MVESVGGKPWSVSDRGVARVAAAGAVRAAEPAAASVRTAPDPGIAPALGQVARQLAGTAPVDGDRVSMIKKAIAAGEFPILPATVADRLIALRLEWNGNDQA